MKRDWSRVKGAIGFVFAVVMVANFVYMVSAIICDGMGRCVGW